MALSNSFFQSVLDAEAEQKDNLYRLTFQRVKIPLRHVEELGVLQSIEDGFKREAETTEDEVVITAEKDSELRSFSELETETTIERLIFSSNLIRFFENGGHSRIVPICFPENLFFSPGFQPAFLHYGVRDSLPPVAFDEEKTLQHVRAVIALLFDPSNSFDTYVKFDFATKSTRFVKDIFRCKTFHALAGLVENERKKELLLEKKSTRIPKKKNTIKNGLLIGGIAVLIPLLILTIYAFFIQLPRESLFEQGHEFFLQNRYSDVVTVLSPVAYNHMPNVVRYELAVSYVKNEPLTDTQHTNILNNLTLQSNTLYYQYWIQVGRGDTAGALNTAKSLNDRTLTAYALIKEKLAVQNNMSMSGSAKAQQLQTINSELSQYKDITQGQKSTSGSSTSGSGSSSANVSAAGSSQQGASTQSGTSSPNQPAKNQKSTQNTQSSGGSSGKTQTGSH
ncbi:type VII secretion protein EssB [Sporolactobacillus sp. KGMB 08714]|uniref:type VII secretion protein EssB n=1 Tax=Sporolactobacillus sp. KGMB 08714 TaxID=3064704 RepID=UPI002FBE5902